MYKLLRSFDASLLFLLTSSAILLFCLEAGRKSQAESRFDFGLVDRDIPLQHSFVAENLGSTPITIDRVVPSCSSCSEAKLVCDKADCSIVNPGESVIVFVTIDLQKLSGNVSREFYLYWHDSTMKKSERTVFRATARVGS
jgi:hypothetical protein